MDYFSGTRVLFNEIKKGDLVLVKRLGISPLPSANRFSFLAFILEGPYGDAGKYTFESKKGSGVILNEELDTSCNIYYNAIVHDKICKVYLRHFDLSSLQKK